MACFYPSPFLFTPQQPLFLCTTQIFFTPTASPTQSTATHAMTCYRVRCTWRKTHLRTSITRCCARDHRCARFAYVTSAHNIARTVLPSPSKVFETSALSCVAPPHTVADQPLRRFIITPWRSLTLPSTNVYMTSCSPSLAPATHASRTNASPPSISSPWLICARLFHSLRGKALLHQHYGIEWNRIESNGIE